MKWKYLLVMPIFLLLLVAVQKCWQRLPLQQQVSAVEIPVQEGVRRGVWNGSDASMVVTDVGAVIIFACAQGEIFQPLVLNEFNQFQGAGSYLPVNGSMEAAEYSGLVDGTHMELHHGDEVYNLDFEAQMSLIRCQ